MATVPVRDLTNATVGEIELDDTVFGERRRVNIVYDEVKRFLAARRAGTHATKTRAMVSGGGRKPWRQKGTGRARHGSTRSPLWRHGGTTHGPQPRSYDMKLNRKSKKLAMRVVLTDKLSEGQLLVLDGIQFEEPKTKRVVQMIHDLELGRSALIVAAADNRNLRLAARNHPDVKIVSAASLSVYDVLLHEQLILTRDSAGQVQEIFRP